MTQLATTTGTHFTQLDAGPIQRWPDYNVTLPDLEIPGKLFIKDILGLTGCEVSINAMPPGGAVPFYHFHQQNEEVYIFIQGQGQLQIDGEILPVKEGSIVRVSPAAERTWRNTANTPLVYIVIQAKQGSLAQYSGGDGVIPEKAPNWA